MKVIPTEQVRAQIEKYRRFLEKPELFNHAAKINEQYYYVVQYRRWEWAEAGGFLVLRPDGEVVSRAESIPVLRVVLPHNHAAIRFTRNLAIDKEKPVWMYEQKRDLLLDLLPYLESHMDSLIRQDIQQLLEVCDTVVKSQALLRAIYEDGMVKINQFIKRNYVTPEDEAELLELLYETDYILYDRLRIQASIRDAVGRIVAFFDKADIVLDKERAKNQKKLVKLLTKYNRPKYTNIMDQSIKSFETWTTGVPTAFQSVQHFKEVYKQRNEKFFQEEVIPFVRNP
ncbi:hypothetical protein G3578_17895 [Brevibacillus sp. SYP-B805]|uniref:hypothetical protein n=1 Tax=Brevibacillus sp. SYP-B805 TaxID=1578199 RepID=UPI0013E9FDFB|nr:hypothetical protein [Brevibacillus sp. SYP-B805]NGQ97038.1 hypothetical protein [Brevibacillus sp. SYP-B805]